MIRWYNSEFVDHLFQLLKPKKLSKFRRETIFIAEIKIQVIFFYENLLCTHFSLCIVWRRFAISNAFYLNCCESEWFVDFVAVFCDEKLANNAWNMNQKSCWRILIAVWKRWIDFWWRRKLRSEIETGKRLRLLEDSDGVIELALLNFLNISFKIKKFQKSKALKFKSFCGFKVSKIKSFVV